MKRHEALQDLSRDHHTALLRAQQVRRAVAGDPRAPSFDVAAGRFMELWREGLSLHFDEEDETLRPLLTGRGLELRARLDDDHAGLRARFERLGQALSPEEADFDATAAHLVRHVRWEEDTLFPWLQEHHDGAALARLWRASMAFRRKHRGDDAVGPGSR